MKSPGAITKFSSVSGFILACAIAAGGTAIAGERQWIAQSGPETASLIYGTPASDDALFSITCNVTDKTITVWFKFEPAYGKNPKTEPIEIFSEGGSVALTGEGSRSQLDDAFSLQAVTPLTPELEKVLTESQTLSLMIEDGAEEHEIDDTARKAIADIVAGCKR